MASVTMGGYGRVNIPSKDKKMSSKTWSSPSAVLIYVMEELKNHPEGRTENQLNTQHDPVLVTRGLDLLVSRGALNIYYDDTKVGSARKLYKLEG